MKSRAWWSQELLLTYSSCVAAPDTSQLPWLRLHQAPPLLSEDLLGLLQAVVMDPSQVAAPCHPPLKSMRSPNQPGLNRKPNTPQPSPPFSFIWATSPMPFAGQSVHTLPSLCSINPIKPLLDGTLLPVSDFCIKKSWLSFTLRGGSTKRHWCWKQPVSGGGFQRRVAGAMEVAGVAVTSSWKSSGGCR